MEFKLTVNFGFGEMIEFTTYDFWKTLAVADFAKNLEEDSDSYDADMDEAEDEFADEEYEYDEDGVAYWLDVVNDVWYVYDEESNDWYECELVEDDSEDMEEVAE
jgi:hypothetical protein